MGKKRMRKLKTVKISWIDIEIGCDDLVRQFKRDNKKFDIIVGISRGGLIPSTILSHKLDIPLAVVSIKNDEYMTNEKIAFHNKFKKEWRILIVDDIYDNGNSISCMETVITDHLPENKMDVAVLFSKNGNIPYTYKTYPSDVWLEMPWEI